MRYPKTYTQKEWNRFSKNEVSAEIIGNDYYFINFLTGKKESYETISNQELLCLKYDVILTDYKTKKEKVMNIISKINIQNLNKGIDKFNKGVDDFSRVMASSNKKSKKTKFKL